MRERICIKILVVASVRGFETTECRFLYTFEGESCLSAFVSHNETIAAMPMKFYFVVIRSLEKAMSLQHFDRKLLNVSDCVRVFTHKRNRFPTNVFFYCNMEPREGSQLNQTSVCHLERSLGF